MTEQMTPLRRRMLDDMTIRNTMGALRFFYGMTLGQKPSSRQEPWREGRCNFDQISV
jgi:hypothetical protein